MSDVTGYVVVEFNQASHQPSLAWKFAHLYDTAEDAYEVAEHLTSEARSVGRKETYAIGTVTIEED